MTSKPSHALVEGKRAVEVGDLEVDVADVHAGVERHARTLSVAMLQIVLALLRLRQREAGRSRPPR